MNDGGLKLTVSEVIMFGTATRISSDESCPDERLGDAGVQANEQKFIVLTSTMCKIHGCFLGSGAVSTGNTELIDSSSTSDSFHTTNLLSLPCLHG